MRERQDLLLSRRDRVASMVDSAAKRAALGRSRRGPCFGAHPGHAGRRARRRDDKRSRGGGLSMRPPPPDRRGPPPPGGTGRLPPTTLSPPPPPHFKTYNPTLS